MARKASKKRRVQRQRRLRKRLAALVGSRVADEVIAGRVSVRLAVEGLGEPERGQAIQLAEQLRGEMNR
jgi:hypothetical protein